MDKVVEGMPILVVKVLNKYYLKVLNRLYKKDTANPLLAYRDLVLLDQEHDTHIFNYGEKIQIEFQYSIAIINKIYENEKITNVPLSNVLKMLENDINRSKDIFAEISKSVSNRHKHPNKALIIMRHTLSGEYFIIDGRHRLVEYIKFSNLDTKIPILLVDSERISVALLNRNAFVAYQMEHNLFVLRKYPFWKALKFYNPISPLLRMNE